MKNPFQILSKQVVYDNDWIVVTDHRVVKPRGGEGVYGVVHFKNRAVGIVPYEAGHIWLVGQYRFPLGQYSWEIPEGGAPDGEDLEECAHRELAEETGLRAGKLQRLFTLHTSNSVTDEEAYVFLATELATGSAHPEDTEELAIRRLPLDEAYEMLKRGEITDGISMAAILRVVLLRNEGALPE